MSLILLIFSSWCKFNLKKVDEFDEYKNAREEQCDINVAEMK